MTRQAIIIRKAQSCLSSIRPFKIVARLAVCSCIKEYIREKKDTAKMTEFQSDYRHKSGFKNGIAGYSHN
jgi:hypothetical protein